LKTKEIEAIWEKHGLEVVRTFTEMKISKEIAEVSFKAGQEQAAEAIFKEIEAKQYYNPDNWPLWFKALKARYLKSKGG